MVREAVRSEVKDKSEDVHTGENTSEKLVMAEFRKSFDAIHRGDIHVYPKSGSAAVSRHTL